MPIKMFHVKYAMERELWMLQKIALTAMELEKLPFAMTVEKSLTLTGTIVMNVLKSKKRKK